MYTSIFPSLLFCLLLFLESVPDWKDFYPLNIIYNFIDNLEVQYPSTCTVSSIGQTVEGRDIKVCKNDFLVFDLLVVVKRTKKFQNITKKFQVLKISNSNAGNTGVWIDGGIHAREWISISVVIYIADQLSKNLENLPESVTNKDW